MTIMTMTDNDATCLFLNKVDSILLLFFNISVSVLIKLTFLFDVR